MSSIKKKKYQYLYLIEKLWHQNRKGMYYDELGWYQDVEEEEKQDRVWDKNMNWLKRLNNKYKYYKERECTQIAK